jgi:methylenetetrahydrofolate dehydrogenase (NADP+)/methenyltetrahydrofolate cyclohydrolase
MSAEVGLFHGGYTSTNLINEMADFQRDQVADLGRMQQLQGQPVVRPELAVILTDHPGQHAAFPANESYAQRLEAYGERSGVSAHIHTVTEGPAAALDLLHRLNDDPAVHGIIPMLPAPWEVSDKIRETIVPVKDVDGIRGADGPHAAATPDAMVQMAEDMLGEPLRAGGSVGRVAIIGNGPVVGAPLALLLHRRGIDPVVLGSRQEIEDGVPYLHRFADIIFSAVPKARLIHPENLAKGSKVIDVGFGIDPATQRACGNVDPAVYADGDVQATAFRHGVGPVTAALIHGRTIQNAYVASGLPVPSAFSGAPQPAGRQSYLAAS